MGWGGGGGVVVVAHVILVSAQGPNPSFSLFWGTFIQLGGCWDRGLDLDLDQGLTIVKVSQNDPIDSSSKKKLTRWTTRSRTWGVPSSEITMQAQIFWVV